MCEQSLSRLESALTVALGRLRSLQADNADLRRENLKLKLLLEELEKENQGRLALTRRYREERSKIRESVKRAVRNVEALERTLTRPQAGSD